MTTFARSATDWSGNVLRGAGSVSAGSEAFSVLVTFSRLVGEPPGLTAPEEMLAASQGGLLPHLAPAPDRPARTDRTAGARGCYGHGGR